MSDADLPDPLRIRTFLVVADDSEEMPRALSYACRRARHSNGRVALLRVIEPLGLQSWMAVADLAQDEERAEAERLMLMLAGQAQAMSGKMPVLHIRQGDPVEELLDLVAEDNSISILVLAAAAGERPGPIIGALSGQAFGKLRIPVTIIPAGLSQADIEAVS